MSARPHFTIAARLTAAQLVLANSLAEAEIQSLVGDYGYSPQKLAEGQSRYEAAVAAVNDQLAAHGAQAQASGELHAAEKSARDAYQALAKVSRAVFQSEKPRLQALGLEGAMPASTAGFSVAAHALFANAVTAPALSDYGYEKVRLESEHAKIVAFDEADHRQEAAKGAAQDATRFAEAALESIDAWRAQYLKVARVALRNRPQLLEKLGVPARTSKTAAQVAAAQKKRAGKQAVAG